MKLERAVSIGLLGLSLLALPTICESGCATIKSPAKRILSYEPQIREETQIRQQTRDYIASEVSKERSYL